jgi:ribose-phosphate pyrophosphokinase
MLIHFVSPGVSPSGKAVVFGTTMRRFESFHPNIIFMKGHVAKPPIDERIGETLLFSGSSHPEFAREIGEVLSMPMGKAKLSRFPDGEIDVQILENVRGRDTFVVQTIANDPNFYLMELLIMIDALKRASAKSVVAVLPYYGYCRQDRKDKPRVPITAKLVANMLVTAGATRVITMDLHAGQLQGFFDIPLDNLQAQPTMIEGARNLASLPDRSPEWVVVVPDIGSVKLGRSYAAQLGLPLAVVEKNRLSPTDVDIGYLIGDVKNKIVLLVDDMCSTGGTLASAANACHKKGARQIFALITHGLFSGDALKKIFESPIEKLYVSNTIPHAHRQEEVERARIATLSVAPLFAQAVHCIICNESISSLFAFEEVH